MISPLVCFKKSSFRDSDVVIGSCTTEENEASSANNLATELNPSNIGPSMEPWGIPALM